MLYPLKFTPAMKDYIWGGRGLEKLGKTLPEGIVAESWEISGHPDGLGVVSNGSLKGKTIPELLEKYGQEFAGTAVPPSSLIHFPLLVKVIDANDRLSVQVHPNDDYARIHENGGLGKTEMWVVLDAKPGAKLIYGLKDGVTKEIFSAAVQKNNIESCLEEIPVKKGDFFDIPAGLVHAIGAGIIIAEIQQSSNTTYRVFDYNRKDAAGNTRPLHIEKALDVIDFHAQPYSGQKQMAATLATDSDSQTLLVKNKYFAVERLVLKNSLSFSPNGYRFELLMVLAGEAILSWNGGEMVVKMGESILVPANVHKYSIHGHCTALRAWVPGI